MSFKPGQTVKKDPGAELVYEFDWTEWLSSSAQIQTSTFSIGGTDENPVTLTKDNESIVTGGKKTRVRLIGGALRQVYTLTNRIVTNETPAQTDDRSIRVEIMDN